MANLARLSRALSFLGFRLVQTHPEFVIVPSKSCVAKLPDAIKIVGSETDFPSHNSIAQYPCNDSSTEDL